MMLRLLLLVCMTVHRSLARADTTPSDRLLPVWGVVPSDTQRPRQRPRWHVLRRQRQDVVAVGG